MITYDYRLERDIGQSKIRVFEPGIIPKKFDSLVIIEGPNSSAKSTLLNIIALGLYGNRSKRVNPVLQDKLNALLDFNHQHLTFSFKIYCSDKLVLEVDKKDPKTQEIIVKEVINGQAKRTLNYENFEKEYNLIYDIPNNPTERLKELLRELREEQSETGEKIRNFGFYLHNTIAAINNSRNLSRLLDVQKQLSDARSKRAELEKKIPELQSFLSLLEKRAFAYYYCKYSNDGVELTRKKDELQKGIQSNGLDLKKRVDKIHKDKWQLEELSKSLIEKYNTLTPLLQDLIVDTDRSRFKIWTKINPYYIESIDLDNIREESTHYIEAFGAETQKLEKTPAFQDANVLEQIIRSLKEFESSGLKIQKLDITIHQFIEMLKEENKKSSLLIQRYYSLLENINGLKEIRAVGDQLQIAQRNYKEEVDERSSGSSADDYYQKNSQLKQMAKDLESLAAKCNEYYQKCLSKGITEKSLECASYREITRGLLQSDIVEKYLQLGEKQVMDNILELQTEIENKRIELSGLNIVIPRYEKDVHLLEQMKPHKFEGKLAVLTKLENKTAILTSKILSEYTTNVTTLMNSKKDAEKNALKDQNCKKYYFEVSKYLGHRLGSFRHIDKTYKAAMVDLITGKIISEDNETIYLNDMGTGQTQSAYISSLLNVDATDSRKIVAMFDEIAMMDDTSLEPILTRMKQLYEEKRLILGILVQRSNKFNLISIGERAHG
jgi:exonuclease SbcC